MDPYEKLEQDFQLAVLQREDYWNDLFHKANSQAEKMNIREQQAQESQDWYNDFQEQMTQLNQNRQVLLEALNESESKISHDTSTIESLQMGVGELAENISELKQEIKRKQHELDNVNKQKNQLIDKTNKFQLTSSELQSCLAELHEVKTVYQAEQKMYREELATSQDHLKLCKISISELEADLEKERRNHLDLSEQLILLRNDKKTLHQEKQNLVDALDASKLSLEEQQKQFQLHLNHSEKNAQNLIHSCEEKLHQAKQQNDARTKQFAELENEFLLMKELNATVISEPQIMELQRLVKILSQENAQLKSVVVDFQQSNPQPDLVGIIQDSHRELSQNMKKSHKQILECDLELSQNNKLVQSQAAEIKLLQAHTKALETKISSCLFPGEKRVLLEQLERTILKRNEISDVMAKVLSQNRELVQEQQVIKAESRKSKMFLDKYKLDLDSLGKLTQESAGLHAELIESQQSLKEKDAHLSTLAKQLDVVLVRSHEFEKQNEHLREKLRFASDPEQLEFLNKKLMQCQALGNETNIQADKLSKTVKHLEDTSRLNNDKIRSLVDVLKQTEDSKLNLVKEQETTRQLRQALTECAQQKEMVSKDLGDRLKALDHQYQANLIEHEKMMREAVARIAELEPKRMNSYDPPEYNVAISNVQQDLQALQAGKSPRYINETENARAEYFQRMQEKEVQIMQTREQVLDEVRAALNTTQDQTLLKQRIDAIYARGESREQQYNKDMLELQALNEHLAREYEILKKAHWNSLEQLNRQTKQDVVNTLQDPAKLQSIVNTRDQIADSQNTYVANAKRDLERQLEAQNRYDNHLKTNIIPKMKQTEAMIETLDMPALSNLQSKLSQSSQMAIESLDREDNEAEDNRRGISLLEDKLKALQTERNRLSSSIADWIKKPGPKARTDIIEAANDDAQEIMKRQKAAAILNDNRHLRINLVVAPRTPEQIAAGIPAASSEEMKTNLDKNQIIITQNGQPTKYHANTLTLLENPDTVLSNIPPRFGRALQEKKDLIYVSYAYETTSNVKYIMFLTAIEKLFVTIQKYMGTNKSFQIKMVRISSSIARADLIGNKELNSECTFATCNSKEMTIKNLDSPKAILDNIKTLLPATYNDHPDYHIVLSLLFPSHTIHIVDVLFSTMSDTDIRLLDRNWINYLAPVIMDNNYYMDLYFNVMSTGDPESLRLNNAMLQLNYRTSKWLTEFQTLSASRS
jgi:FtsZ-binding cell division protein ZapB